MHCTSGRVLLNKAGHRVAYCAQNPWLEHATIRDNILFGAPYDEERYNKGACLRAFGRCSPTSLLMCVIQWQSSTSARSSAT